MTGFWPREVEFELRDLTTLVHVLDEMHKRR